MEPWPKVDGLPYFLHKSLMRLRSPIVPSRPVSSHPIRTHPIAIQHHLFTVTDDNYSSINLIPPVTFQIITLITQSINSTHALAPRFLRRANTALESHSNSTLLYTTPKPKIISRVSLFFTAAPTHFFVSFFFFCRSNYQYQCLCLCLCLNSGKPSHDARYNIKNIFDRWRSCVRMFTRNSKTSR